MARLPLVVGTYLSEPGAQLEFRNGGGDGVAGEHHAYERLGVRG
jgi:hypothetical protein